MKGRWMMGGILLLLSGALALAALLRMAENQVQEQQAREEVQQVLETENRWYGEEYCAVLELADLELILPVLDHYTEAELRRTPCLYSGSLESGKMVITAHNYRHHFGRLGELEPGAQLILRTKEGAVRYYRLEAIEELSPADVEAMVDSDWPLTLYTCTYDLKAMLTLRWGHMEESIS